MCIRDRSNTAERLEGFSKAMEEIGMTEINSYPYRYHGDYSLESGIDAIRKLASFSEPPTAILATNNTMTIGALKALKQLNLRIPEEISIAGFNGIDQDVYKRQCGNRLSSPVFQTGIPGSI